MKRTVPSAWRNRAASLALAGTLALSTGAVVAGLAPTVALAENGAVTITQKANPDATYDVYRLFTADIDGSDVATNVQFVGDDEAKNALVQWLKGSSTGASTTYDAWLAAKGRTSTGDDLIPQNMLEYISEEISKSSSVKPGDIQSEQDWKDGASFASKLAEYVKSNGTTFKQSGVATSGEQYKDVKGYYLFVSTSSTVSEKDAATLPIWLPLGGSVSTIEEKAIATTIDKQVKDPTDQDWQDAEDAEVGKSMDYRIMATIPADYSSYDEYSVKLTDTLPEGLVPVVTMGSGTAVTGGVTVKVGNADVTSKFTITYDSSTRQLVISHADLMDAATGVSQIGPNSQIVVEYQAEVTSVEGAIPTVLENKVVFEYPNNPDTDGKGKTDEEKVKVYTFGIDIAKTDKSTSSPLAGAGFVIKSNATNKYLAYDSSADEWSWTADAQNAAAEFVTNDSGDLTYTYDSGENTGKTIEYIPGLEAGTYTVTEVTAPEDYALPANPNITVTMVPTYENGELTSLKAQVSGSIVAGQDVTDVDSDGVIDITVTNDKEFSLAVTGAEGVGLGGAAVLAIGLGWYLVRRHRLSATQE